MSHTAYIRIDARLWLLALLLFACAGLALADGLPTAMDPAAPKSVRYLALKDEVSRQQAALNARFYAARRAAAADIDARREALHASTDDEIERAEWGGELDALGEEAVAELRSELAVFRARLVDKRRAAFAELNREGAFSDATWAEITGYAASVRFARPRVLRDEPPIELETLFEGFAAAVYECRPDTEAFAHRATQEPLTRSVFGVVDGRCHFQEQMPAGGLKTCHFSLERLNALAEHFADAERESRLSFTTKNAFVSGQAVTVNSWTLDGRPYEHPLDAAMNAGECRISGY